MKSEFFVKMVLCVLEICGGIEILVWCKMYFGCWLKCLGRCGFWVIVLWNLRRFSMFDCICFILDGQEVEVDKGLMIWEIVNGCGLVILYLCYKL